MAGVEARLAVLDERLDRSAEERKEMLDLLKEMRDSQMEAQSTAVTQHALMIQRLDSGTKVMESLSSRSTFVEKELMSLAFFKQTLEGTTQRPGVEKRLSVLERKDQRQSAIIGAAAALGAGIVGILGWAGTYILEHMPWPTLK